ncbi:transporter [Opitutaceae bacterium EW11]|nr:transporter [Opitutaceae bacterium EW11]
MTNQDDGQPLNPGRAGASRDPLHGVTLETIVKKLVDWYGWEELGTRIDIRCFKFDPSIKSSLQFLRRTPWARAKVEALYVETVQSR